MPAFRYTATGRDGSPKKGIIQADNLQDANNRVHGRGWTPVSVERAILPKQQEFTPVPSSGKRTVIIALVLLLLLAGAVFVYFDPWNLFPQLERYRP